MISSNEIRDYYVGLRNDIKVATKRKTLAILEKHSRQYMHRMTTPAVKPALRKKAMSEHKKTLKAIQAKRKQLK